MSNYQLRLWQRWTERTRGNYKYSKVGIIAYQRVITADNTEIFNKKSHQLPR